MATAISIATWCSMAKKRVVGSFIAAPNDWRSARK